MALKIAVPVPPDVPYLNYFAALEALGAEGVRVTPQDDPTPFAGLLLPGGEDIDPSYYGRKLEGSHLPDAALDTLQMAVTDRFERAGKPIFGICRGHQLLNVYYGGTLVQDLWNKHIHKWDEASDADRIHPTRAQSGSWVEALYGTDFVTNSSHHQAVELPGKGLIADQFGPGGVVEALHHVNGRVFSVQWHPERMCFRHRREDTVDGSIVLRFFLRRCGG